MGLCDQTDKGVDDIKERLWQKFLDVIGAALEKIGVPTKWIKAGSDFILNIIKGIDAAAEQLWTKVRSIGEGILNTLKGKVEEHSPSKATYRIGAYLDQGLANGINDYSRVVNNSAAKMGDDLLGTIKDTMGKTSDYVNQKYNPTITPEIDFTNFAIPNDNFQPTITPVVDLSNVTAGAGNINKLFENTKTQELAWQASADGNFNVMTDLTRQLNSKFDGFSNEDVVTELTGLRGDMATMNERLGRMQVVMDTGTLVGALGPGMDNYLGSMSVLAGRGV